jgi:hypothetical protein
MYITWELVCCIKRFIIIYLSVLPHLLKSTPIGLIIQLDRTFTVEPGRGLGTVVTDLVSELLVGLGGVIRYTG